MVTGPVSLNVTSGRLKSILYFNLLAVRTRMVTAGRCNPHRQLPLSSGRMSRTKCIGASASPMLITRAECILKPSNDGRWSGGAYAGGRSWHEVSARTLPAMKARIFISRYYSAADLVRSNRVQRIDGSRPAGRKQNREQGDDSQQQHRSADGHGVQWAYAK